jgi:hypothetical protein
VGVLGVRYFLGWPDGCGGSSESLHLEGRQRLMKRRTPEERYNYSTRKQQKTLEEFAAHEIEWADDLMYWYKIRNEDIPEDQYRACAFFKNREYLMKPGSLSLLYQMYIRCLRELPSTTRETAFDILCFRYKMYAAVLKTGGYDGRTDWQR